jgi:hypothetical protein
MLCTGFVLLSVAIALGITTRNSEEESIDVFPIITLLGLPGFINTFAGTLLTACICCDICDDEEER